MYAACRGPCRWWRQAQTAFSRSLCRCRSPNRTIVCSYSTQFQTLCNSSWGHQICWKFLTKNITCTYEYWKQSLTFLIGRSLINAMTSSRVGWIRYWPLGLFLSEQTLASIVFGAIPTSTRASQELICLFIHYCIVLESEGFNFCRQHIWWLCINISM